MRQIGKLWGVWICIFILILGGCQNQVETLKHIEETPLLGQSVNKHQSIYWLDCFYQKDEIIYAMKFYGEDLYLIKGEESSNLEIGVYDITTNTYEKKITLKDFTSIINCYLCENGYLFINVPSDQKFVVYNKKFEVVCSGEQFQLSDIIIPYSNGSGFLYVNEERSQLLEYKFDTKKSRCLFRLSEGMNELSIMGLTKEGEYILGCCVMEEGIGTYLLIDTISKEYALLNEEDASYYVQEDVIIRLDQKSYAEGYIEFFNPEKSRALKKFYFEKSQEVNDYYYNKDTTSLLTLCDGTNQGGETNILLQVRLYDTEEEQLLRESQITRDEYAQIKSNIKDSEIYIRQDLTLLSESGNYASFCITDSDGMKVYLWDLNVEEDVVKDYSFSISLGAKESKLGTNNDERVKELENTYGIKIRIRNDAVRFFPDFAVNACLDEKTIQSALLELTTVLERFPKKLFQELLYDRIHSFEVFLCGTLVQGNEMGISNPAGFALVYDSKQMVVIDINLLYTIQSNFAHEVMHAIEAKAEYLIAEGVVSDDLLSRWNQYNPRDFHYYESYVDSYGNEYTQENSSEYTPEDCDVTDNIDRIYFIDYYCSTYAFEDRARMFETLMSASKEGLPEYFASESLVKKAVYLCEIIRQTIPSVQEEKQVYWEKFLPIQKE